MTKVNDINELNKIIRTQLIKQSELDGEFVRNALTTYGTDLDKLLTDSEYSSIVHDDAIILFELQTRQNQSDVSMTESDESVSYFKSYTIHIVLYGNESQNIASRLIARFRTEAVRQDLLTEGVYIETVSDDTSINEYLHDTLWHRHDFDINISCQMSVEQIDTGTEFEEQEDIKTYVVNRNTNG